MRVRALGIAVMVLAASARADVISLTDGSTYSGSMSRRGDTVTISADDGRVVSVPRNQIAKVTLVSTITPEQAAKAEWTRVSAQVKNADDLETIVGLHQRFLSKYGETAMAGDVQSSLNVFLILERSHAMKFRGKWLPPAAIDVLVKGWVTAAAPAVELYKAGRMKEALAAAKKVADGDKENPDALAIAGLAAYRQNNLGTAKSYFTQLAAADPGSPMAENNLGVICFQQNQGGEGISHYAKALQIMPDHPVLLDNVIEAMHAYGTSGGNTSATLYKSLQRQFEAAEKQAEEAMASKGMYRWASTWVTRGELDRLHQNQGALQDQLAQLEDQYLSAREQVRQMEAEILDADARAAEAASRAIQLDRRLATLTPAEVSAYLIDLMAERDIANQDAHHFGSLKDQLVAERAATTAQANQIFAVGQQLQAAIDHGASQLSGTQRIIDLGEVDRPPAPIPPKELHAVTASPTVERGRDSARQ